MHRLIFTLFCCAIFMLSADSALARFGPGGRLAATLVAGQTIPAGTVAVYNTRGSLNVETATQDGWLIKEIQIFAGDTATPIPMTKVGNPIPGKFPFKAEYAAPVPAHVQAVDFLALGFAWGSPYESKRLQRVAVHADLVKLDGAGAVVAEEGAWAYSDMHAIDFPGAAWGWYVEYEMAHPKRGHFWDSPVDGLSYETGAGKGKTAEGGAFDYFPGEQATFAVGNIALGTAVADHRVTPLDFFDGADLNVLENNPAINMARLLQSLDENQKPKDGITITDSTVACLNTAAAELNIDSVNFADDTAIDELISATVGKCTQLVAVSAEAAKDHLDKELSNSMFRKNVSKTPEMATAKSKLELMPVLVPATKANGEPATYEDSTGATQNGVAYYDEAGNFLYARTQVRPLVAVYADQVEETGMSDTFGAVSRDDGKTWKRMNLSRAADRSSFTLENGEPYYGDVKKPNLKVVGNYILAVWQSKFARGGRPAYSIQVCPDTTGDGLPDPCEVCKGSGENEHCGLDDPSDDIYYQDDIFGVGGPQRSHDYTEDGFPEVGELPFYTLWACRGVIDPATGDIKWRKPERLTSGRRDVWQVAVNGAKDVGFGVVWQEDPEGVRPGEMAGPGHGWSGATTNHKTDIWYSSITWADFATLDEDFSPNGDPEHSFDDPEWTSNRPMWRVPMSLPIRLSDNDVANTDNMQVQLGEDGFPVVDLDGHFIPVPNENATSEDASGTHRYAYLIDDNSNDIPDLCADFHTFVNEQGVTKHVCITEDGRLLDGDTGASRPNISLMPYKKKDGTQSAWVAIVYEETKGVGGGAPDHTGEPPYGGEDTKPDSGKNIIYHSFEFASPVKVSGGDIVNLPARDEAGNLLYLVDYETGERVLDHQGLPQLAYENARRPRMLVQPPGNAGSSGTVMVMVYKQGEEGKGRPSDIFLRRINKNLHTGGNPYAFQNFVCNETMVADSGQTVCIDAAQNLSSVTPTEYWTNPNQDDQAKGEGIKVVKYEQTVEDLEDASWENPYDDARAHRGIVKGNNVFIAYDYTPNWAASRNAHDKYDLFIRRSFDGGVTWTTDPQGTGNVCHNRIWKDYNTIISEDDANKKATYEETVCFAPGVFEPARNMSQLKNNKESVIEPRLVGTPGTTPDDPNPEGIQNTDVYYVTFGTATNVPKPHGNYDEEEELEHATPVDLYYTFTRDRGQTYFKRLWEVNPDSSGNYAGQTVERYDYLAKGDPEQGEAQIRMTPDGSRFYAVWNQEGEEGSDCWFRRIMSADFPQNVAPSEPVSEP